jgi:protein O-mannosyl-transferase
MTCTAAQRWRIAGICAGLVAITCAVFGQTLRHGFVNFDDGDYVYANPVVLQGLTARGFKWAFARGHAYNWHPLTWLSHMLDSQIYGQGPTGPHFTNVLLHAATVLALFLTLRAMTGALWRSAFVAAVFAIHPLRAESVAWISERKDVLSGLFFVLTLAAYTGYARRRSVGRHALVVLVYAIGLMCKPMLVTLPLVLLALDYWPLQRTESLARLVLEKTPLLALSAASCAATLWAQTELIQPTALATPALRIANAIVAVAIYLRQLIWPTGLAVFYPFPYNGLAPWKPALAALLLGGITVAVFRLRRRQPWLLSGWLWYLIMLLPVLGFIQVGRQAHADRYTYLPEIGVCMALTWTAAECFTKRQFNRVATGALMAGVIVALMACAWKQTTYWQDSETLWMRDLACTGPNEVAHFMLGDAMMRQKGGLAAGMTQFQLALELNDTYEPAQESLGLALLELGKVEDAIRHLQSAAKLSLGEARPSYLLGNALMQAGRLDEAIAQFRQALDAQPDYAEARNNLGVALLQRGRVDEAITECQQAAELRPDLAETHITLGNALCQKGRLDEGIAQYKAALQINPDSPDAKNNLAKALKQKGQSNK